MNVGERLSNIIDHLNHNTSSFSRSIGLNSNVTLMRIVKGDSAPSFQTLQKIKEAYPAISIEWLVSGEGAMIKNSDRDSKWFEEALEKAQKEIEWHKELINTLQNALNNQSRSLTGTSADELVKK